MSSAANTRPSSPTMRDDHPVLSHAALSAPGLRHNDSWVEVSSQPSSSSASSVHDEVITHGLRVQRPSTFQRRRQTPLHLSLRRQRTENVADSSQDEADESESESDQVMTSSNEDPRPAHHIALASSSAAAVAADNLSSEECEDDDENATALGVGSNNQDVFTPQPNAFSHPPSSHLRGQQQSSYFSSTRPAPSRGASQRLNSATAAPSRAADHDAALRASLTTLLSCAAAARNQPRPTQTPPKTAPVQRQRPGAYVEPSTLRMIPASEMNRRRRSSSSASQRHSSTSPCHSEISAASDKNKRKALRSGSKDRRAVKRLRAAGVDEVISPTLLTWVVSAGVLVLVGALSFSAGYASGREAERAEAGLSAAVSAGECGRQSRSGLGLRRRLFGGAAQVVSV